MTEYAYVLRDDADRDAGGGAVSVATAAKEARCLVWNPFLLYAFLCDYTEFAISHRQSRFWLLNSLPWQVNFESS